MLANLQERVTDPGSFQALTEPSATSVDANAARIAALILKLPRPVQLNLRTINTYLQTLHGSGQASGSGSSGSVATEILDAGAISNLAKGGGQVYVEQCREAGVPVPPPWGSPKWVDRGVQTRLQIDPAKPAKVYTHETDEGICVALPRYRSDSMIDLLGIICQGNKTSKACFWDSRAGTDIPANPAVPVPIVGGDIVGGTELATNGQGVCSDCHAGENAFVVYPLTALDLGMAIRAQNYVQPIVAAADWPFDRRPRWVSPTRRGPLEGGSYPFYGNGEMEYNCNDCHTYTGEGGRFPELPDFPGYCLSVVRGEGMDAMQRYAGVSPETHAQIKTAMWDLCNLGEDDYPENPSKFQPSFGPNGDPLLVFSTLQLRPGDKYLVLDQSRGWEGYFNLFNFGGGFWFTPGSNAQLRSERMDSSVVLAPESASYFEFADVTGDGKSDVLIFGDESTTRLRIVRGSESDLSFEKFMPAESIEEWGGDFDRRNPWVIGDFNYDGRADLLSVDKSRGNRVTVNISTGQGFRVERWGELFPAMSIDLVKSGDVNGDGSEDLVFGSSQDPTEAWVALSTGRRLLAPKKWVSGLFPFAGFEVGDFDGDALDDLAVVVQNPAGDPYIYVSKSDGISFTGFQLWFNPRRALGYGGSRIKRFSNLRVTRSQWTLDSTDSLVLSFVDTFQNQTRYDRLVPADGELDMIRPSIVRPVSLMGARHYEYALAFGLVVLVSLSKRKRRSVEVSES